MQLSLFDAQLEALWNNIGCIIYISVFKKIKLQDQHSSLNFIYT